MESNPTTNRRMQAMDAGAGVTVNVMPGPTRPGSNVPLTVATRPAAPSKPIWGSIPKGVLVVGAAVLVGVAVFAIASVAIPALIGGSMTASTILGAIGSSASTVWTTTTTLVSAAWSAVIESFLPSMATVLGTGNAAPMVATDALVATTSLGGGAIAGAGAAVASMPLINKMMPMFDHAHHAAGAAIAPMPDDGGHSTLNATTIGGKKAAILADSVPDMPDMPDDMLTESNAVRATQAGHAGHANHASSMAAKMGHHAAEDGHEHAKHQQEAMMARMALERGAQASKNWADRVGSRPGSRAPIQPRDTSYTAQMDAENIAANTQFGTPNR